MSRDELKAQALKVLLDADEAHAPEGSMWPELAEAIVDAGWRPIRPQDMVREFHARFGIAVRTEPVADPPESDLRTRLLAEEVQEYYDAVEAGDVIGVADGLADVVYVAYGTALNHGIDLDAVLAEVHRSNMSKLGPDGKPLLRDDGKVIKGPNYFKPDIAGVLRERAS